MSKTFIPDLSHSEVTEKSKFRMTWPRLQTKAYVSSVHEHLRALEEKTLKEAKEKSALIEKEAYEKGFAQGEKDGFELGRKRVETVIHQFELILLNLRDQQQELYKEFEKKMVELVIRISQRVIRHELTLREDTIQKTLEEAFRHVSDRTKILVRLHPADYRSLSTYHEKFPWIKDQTENITVVEDPLISRGGCLLETPFGEVDATIEGQFDEIVSSIWNQWESKEKQSDPQIP
ncbi:MAG: FliH/SctL family protein [Thermodesulfobacteriota bacterium]